MEFLKDNKSYPTEFLHLEQKLFLSADIEFIRALAFFGDVIRREMVVLSEESFVKTLSTALG